MIWTRAETCIIPSPRVILVEDRGVLAGLVTVKDVLRFATASAPIDDGTTTWDQPEEFDGLLEEAWTWAAEAADSIWSWSRGLLRR